MSNSIPVETWANVEQNFRAWPAELVGVNALLKKLEELVEQVENGKEAWKCPWSKSTAMPRNWRGTLYRRGNILSTILAGFSNPFWFTIKQINELGGKIRKGEKPTLIVAYPAPKVLKEEDPDGNEVERKIPGRPFFYKEWNAEQVDWPPEIAEKIAAKTPKVEEFEHTPIERAEQAFAAMPNPPKIIEGGSRALYRPLTDEVHVPELKRYEVAAEYYSTKGHELVHSTGHKDRCNRPSIADRVKFDNTSYSFEELVAELGSFILLAHLGIEDTSTQWNSAAYVRGWLDRLKDHPEMLATALRQAQKAAEYVLDIKYVAPKKGEERSAAKIGKKKAAKKKSSKKTAKKSKKKIGKKVAKKRQKKAA